MKSATGRSVPRTRTVDNAILGRGEATSNYALLLVTFLSARLLYMHRCALLFHYSERKESRTILIHNANADNPIYIIAKTNPLSCTRRRKVM